MLTSPQTGSWQTPVNTCIANCGQTVSDTSVVCIDSLWEHAIAIPNSRHAFHKKGIVKNLNSKLLEKMFTMTYFIHFHGMSPNSCLLFHLLCRKAKYFERTANLIKQRYHTPGGNDTTEPTFKEFVRFLTDPRTKRPFDRHWMPFHKLCRPCHIHYNFIGHVETLRQDSEYILNKIGLQNVHLFHVNPSQVKASSIVAKEMATLSPDEIKKLIDIYRLDFLLFGYSTKLPAWLSLIPAAGGKIPPPSPLLPLYIQNCKRYGHALFRRCQGLRGLFIAV